MLAIDSVLLPLWLLLLVVVAVVVMAIVYGAMSDCRWLVAAITEARPALETIRPCNSPHAVETSLSLGPSLAINAFVHVLITFAIESNVMYHRIRSRRGLHLQAAWLERITTWTEFVMKNRKINQTTQWVVHFDSVHF